MIVGPLRHWNRKNGETSNLNSLTIIGWNLKNCNNIKLLTCIETCALSFFVLIFRRLFKLLSFAIEVSIIVGLWIWDIWLCYSCNFISGNGAHTWFRRLLIRRGIVLFVQEGWWRWSWQNLLRILLRYPVIESFWQANRLVLLLLWVLRITIRRYVAVHRSYFLFFNCTLSRTLSRCDGSCWL
jgi:hypothetical protein